jgi:diguanylate cyclase (GGDEF)-like protein
MPMKTPYEIRSFSLNYWVAISGIAACIIAFLTYVHFEKEIDRANDMRHHSHLLASELRQSSDDLTRMVRTYVATGEVIYKQHYQEILDVREGKKPRPIQPYNIYWDLVQDNDQRPRPNGEAVPLLQLMQQAGFTEAEFAKLAQAKANSDDLTNTEFEAMRLIESAANDDDAVWIKATQMLYDAHYHQAKAEIMRPISELYQMMDVRTMERVHEAESAALILRFVFIFFCLFLIVLLWNTYNSMRTTLGISVNGLYDHIVRIGGGNFMTPIDVPKGMENSILGWLAETQAKLAQAETEHKRLESELRDQAITDSLTGLGTRRHFLTRLEDEYTRLHRLNSPKASVLMLDLDHFKSVNDTMGHAVGDAVLVHFANLVMGQVRKIDSVGRLGGEEFAILLPATDLEDAKVFAERLRHKIATTPLVKDGHTIAFTVSIGVACMEDEEPVNISLARADAALYRAKAAGRNKVAV